MILTEADPLHPDTEEMRCHLHVKKKNAFRYRIGTCFVFFLSAVSQLSENQGFSRKLCLCLLPERDAVSKHHKVCSRAAGTLT